MSDRTAREQPAISATLAGIYIASVLLLQLAFHTLMGRSSGLAIAPSTLITAALFGPPHRSIQLGIDRRFYRREYDAARTLDTFGERIRDEVDLGRLSEDLTSVASGTLQPAHVSFWLVDGQLGRDS